MQELTVKFKGYSVEHLELMKKKDKKEISSNDLQIKTTSMKQHKNVYQTVLDVKVSTKDVLITIIMHGLFEIPSSIDDATIDTFLKVNAPTILYPYCRALISTISSFDSESAILLPVINFSQKN